MNRKSTRAAVGRTSLPMVASTVPVEVPEEPSAKMTEFFDLKKAFESIFSRPIAFHAILGRLAGSATCGLMLSQACYWSGNPTSEQREGWFYKTQDEWEEETCLTRREQETARKHLRAKGYIEDDRRGVPAKLWYRVKYEKIWTDLCQSSLWESANPVWRKAPIKNGGKRQSLLLTETTTEITSEKKDTPLVAALPVWVPRQEWDEFCEMRKKIRAPMTEGAKKRTLDDLWKLSQAGEDVGAVLARSVQRGWRGVFAVREENNGQGSGRKTFDTIRRESSVAAIRRTVAGYNKMGGDVHGTKPQGNKRIGDGGVH